MLIKIQQTKSNFENIFEVSSNGQVLFNAKAPWLKISAPFNMENVRKLVFSDVTGSTLYTTKYNIIDNALEESIPFKYLISKEQKFGQFEIIGKNGREGAFYTLQNGLFEKKFCIEHMGKVYWGYSIDKGKRNIVSLYDENIQIAQITKPLTVIENLDIYFLHIKEDFTSLIPVLSFFTIYYDYRKYNNAGEFTKNSVEISVSYSYDKNNSKYNPNWFLEEFGQETFNELNTFLDNLEAEGRVQAKKIGKLVALSFLIIIVIALIILSIIFILI